MNPPRTHAVLRLVCFLALFGAHSISGALYGADLKWLNPVLELDRQPEDKFVEASFTFKNEGNEPAKIKRVRSSCGCTTARLEKETYAPGETGQITAKFVFGGRRGAQRKVITVTEESGKETMLDLRVNIREPLTIDPLLVFWKEGEVKNPKTLTLSSSGDHKVGIRKVTSTDPGISTRLETVEEGRKYRLHVQPTDDQKHSARILVDTDFPTNAPSSYAVYVRVK